MTGSYRYYLTEEREVTKAEYVSAERRAGFYNTLGQPAEPATASFSGRAEVVEIQGRTEYVSDEVPGESESAVSSQES
jgi:hypothetical protein